MVSNYTTQDIKTLEGIEAIRLRPGMYIGSTGPEGVKHITLEIISNAVDEYLNGHCTKCQIIVEDLDKGGYISISDNGRGVPFGKAEDGSETLVNVYTKLHTGAKFDSSGKTGYNTSGGMNGVGAKATNALSEEFTVVSQRDGKAAVAMFRKGELVTYKEDKSGGKDSGTSVRFRPDSSIFKEGIKLDYTALRNQIKELAYLSPGLIFEFIYEDKPAEIITSQNGILDYIKDLNKSTALTSVFYTETLEDRIGVKAAMLYNDNYSDTYKLYTNSIPNSGGTHLTGFRTALTMTVNNYAREKNLLKDKDANLTGEELKEGLVLVLSFVMPDPVFSGQTKDVLSSSEARTIVQRLVSKELMVWLNAHPQDAKTIVEKALLARTAREKAKKAKDAVRNIESKKQKALKFDSKLADCYSKDRSKCEIYITEGDSASGNLKTARNNEFQAVMPVRGKIINTQKASLDKIQKNAEIMTMIEAFGLTINTKTMKITYRPEDLRYGKIIIMSDADVDGSHIKNLFYTFIWNFCPELIRDGYIYAGVPPLYKVTIGKKYKYIKNDEELENFRKENQGKKYIVNRMKGLGEMDVEETEETLTDPNNRIIKQITVEDITAADKLFEDLMGTAIVPRKNYIKAHSEEAIGNV